MLSVYCSGSIAKGSADQKKICWTDLERKDVQQGAGDLEVVFLNPDDPIPDATNILGQFGRDMFQVMTATAVIVDARERRGIGIGVEMAAAATLGTPLIVVAPRNSLYRQDRLEYRDTVVANYVHPHVASLATCVVDDFVMAGAELAKLPTSTGPRHDPPWLTAALAEYEENVLSVDRPMVEALRKLGREV